MGQLICISQFVCCPDSIALLQYEPTIEELRHKYEAAMKEKMLVKLEKDRLAARSEALQAQVRCTQGRAVGGRRRVVSAAWRSCHSCPPPPPPRPPPARRPGWDDCPCPGRGTCFTCQHQRCARQEVCLTCWSGSVAAGACSEGHAG